MSERLGWLQSFRVGAEKGVYPFFCPERPDTLCGEVGIRPHEIHIPQAIYPKFILYHPRLRV